MTTTKSKLIGVLILAAAIAAGGAACGGGVSAASDTRESARDKATKAACDRYQTCGLIGSDVGDTYVTYDSCSIEWRSNWERAWSALTCTAINQPGLSVCMSAIAATDCTNIGDFFATLGKCMEIDVCMPAPTDGGGG
jgi:uncharacterized protein DUF6184